MLVLLLAAALVRPHSLPDTERDAARGASLFRGCQAELRLMTPEALASAAQGDLVNGTYCIGYLNGFIANLSDGQASICTREQPMAELVRAYVAFMEQNPRLLEEDKRVGLRRALQSAFPCPAVGGLPQPRFPSRRDRL